MCNMVGLCLMVKDSFAGFASLCFALLSIEEWISLGLNGLSIIILISGMNNDVVAIGWVLKVMTLIICWSLGAKDRE